MNVSLTYLDTYPLTAPGPTRGKRAHDKAISRNEAHLHAGQVAHAETVLNMDGVITASEHTTGHSYAMPCSERVITAQAHFTCAAGLIVTLTFRLLHFLF